MTQRAVRVGVRGDTEWSVMKPREENIIFKKGNGSPSSVLPRDEEKEWLKGRSWT